MPIRGYVAGQHPPDPEDLERTTEHYLKLALLGNCIRKKHEGNIADVLETESTNIEAMIREGLRFGSPKEAIQAAMAFARYQKFAGFGTTTLLEEARKTSHDYGKALWKLSVCGY